MFTETDNLNVRVNKFITTYLLTTGRKRFLLDSFFFFYTINTYLHNTTLLVRTATDFYSGSVVIQQFHNISIIVGWTDGELVTDCESPLSGKTVCGGIRMRAAGDITESDYLEIKFGCETDGKEPRKDQRTGRGQKKNGQHEF